MNSSEDNIVIKRASWWDRKTTFERRLIIALVIVSAVAFSTVIICITKSRSKSSVQFEEDAEDSESICLSPGCIYAAANVFKYMDTSADPCENFYQFACGGFLESTVIPEDKVSIVASEATEKAVQNQLRLLVEKPPQRKELRPFKLLKVLYNSCMNATDNENEGLDVLNSILKRLGGWPVLERKFDEKHFDWRNFSYVQRKLGIPPYSFLTVHLDTDNKDSSKYIIVLGEAALSTSRKSLIKGLEDDLVKNYYDYMVDVAEILGASRRVAEEQLLESLEFEVELAKISTPVEEYRNITAFYNPMTIRELQRKFPNISWSSYVRNIINIPKIDITDNTLINVMVPKYIQNLLNLLNDTPKRVQASYAVFKLIHQIIPYLTEELRNRQQQYYNKLYGMNERESRWKECLSDVKSMFDIASGALYIREYFDDDAKDNIREMVTDVHAELNSTIQQIEWMDDVTKERALEKVESMTFYVAYPDELRNDKKIEEHYSKLHFDPDDNFLTLILKITSFEYDYMFSKYLKPVDKKDWTMHAPPTMVNAVYFADRNSIDLPAGILQGVYFDHERPRYMNYGSIGYVIGHEIIHGFDDMGRKFNKNGDVEDWWEKNTENAFIKKAKCIVDQYSKLEVPEIKMKLNGINTQGENIADNGGIKLAYNAYQAWVERNEPEPLLPGLNFTQNQMFWISAANTWCEKTRKETLKLTVMDGSHSPAVFRVQVPFSNTQFFAEDFNCPVGSKMNPKKKCEVW